MKVNWKKTLDEGKGDNRRMRFIAAGKQANDCTFDNVMTIEASHHLNGSGPESFGGARTWPHARLDVSFQTGEEAKRDEFVTALKKFTKEFFDNYGKVAIDFETNCDKKS